MLQPVKPLFLIAAVVLVRRLKKLKVFYEKGLGKLGWDPGVESDSAGVRYVVDFYSFLSSHEDPTKRPVVSLVGGPLRMN